MSVEGIMTLVSLVHIMLLLSKSQHIHRYTTKFIVLLIGYFS